MDTKKNDNKNYKLHIFSYKITHEPMTSSYDRKLRSELGKITIEMMQNHPEIAIGKLNDLHIQYPNNPVIMNNLTFCYYAVGEEDKGLAMSDKLRETYPNYLFGYISSALTALSENRHKEIPTIFNNCIDLQQLYPDRNTFHISEVMAFSHVMSKYFCRIGDIRSSRIYYNIMYKLDKEDTRLLDAMQEILALENKINRSSKKNIFWNKIKSKLF